MPYAKDGQISQSPLDGGVEIDEAQYLEALEGMLDGKLVTIAGGFAVIDPPEPEPEPEPEPQPPTIDDYTMAIDVYLDAIARARRYGGAVSISTYVNSTQEAWAAEAVAFVAWRDSVWIHVYTQLDLVMTGKREQPTVEELLSELPEPPWPLA